MAVAARRTRREWRANTGRAAATRSTRRVVTDKGPHGEGGGDGQGVKVRPTSRWRETRRARQVVVAL